MRQVEESSGVETFSHGQKRGPKRSAAAGMGGDDGRRRRMPPPCGCDPKGIAGAALAAGRAIVGGGRAEARILGACVLVRSCPDRTNPLRFPHRT
jgi:hypothetical protein